MGLKSRRKGADAENEVIRIVREVLGVNLRWRLSQYQCGGFDLEPADPEAEALFSAYAIEVKRRARLTENAVNALWEETKEQARTIPGLPIPVLIYRADMQAWRVRCHAHVRLPRMAGELPMSVTMGLGDWLAGVMETAKGAA